MGEKVVVGSKSAFSLREIWLGKTNSLSHTEGLTCLHSGMISVGFLGDQTLPRAPYNLDCTNIQRSQLFSAVKTKNLEDFRQLIELHI